MIQANQKKICFRIERANAVCDSDIDVADSPENNDANIKKIAREVLENRAYVCSHPLERTF